MFILFIFSPIVGRVALRTLTNRNLYVFIASNKVMKSIHVLRSTANPNGMRKNCARNVGRANRPPSRGSDGASFVLAAARAVVVAVLSAQHVVQGVQLHVVTEGNFGSSHEPSARIISISHEFY